MKWSLFFILIISIACKGEQEKTIKPSYIEFSLKKDSIYVSVKNPVACPTFLVLNNFSGDSIINFKPFEEKTVSKIKDSLLDTLYFLKRYKPSLKYGKFPLKEYDTFYNYNLPFAKGKRYKIMQGHFGKFSHYSDLSKYAIDFKMNTGQPIHAMREGIVIKVKEDSNEGGKHKKYYDKANYILIYHKDGTFAQYVHLKQNGAIVEEKDTLQKGQLIGYSGNTGFSSSPHLHFGIYKPTVKGFVSIPYILDSIPSRKYVKGKTAYNN